MYKERRMARQKRTHVLAFESSAEKKINACACEETTKCQEITTEKDEQ